jgi:hypothetical protein
MAGLNIKKIPPISERYLKELLSLLFHKHGHSTTNDGKNNN